MAKEYIKFKHYSKLNTCQPFFIWNELDKKEEIDLDEIEDEEINLWAGLDADFNLMNLEEEKEKKYIEIQSDIFRKGTKVFQEKIQREYGEDNVFIVSAKKVEDAIQQTKKAIQERKHIIIMYPVFEYKDAIAMPTFLNLEERKISNLKFSTSTKLKDYLKAHWDFWITNYNFKLNNYSNYLIDLKDDYKAGEIAFTEVETIGVTKNKKSISKDIKEKFDIIPAEIKKLFFQYGVSEKELAKDANAISKNKAFPFISTNSITLPKKTIELLEINEAIEMIKNAKKNAVLEDISEKDNTDFGANPDFNEIVSEFHPEIANYSGNILKKSKILEWIDESQGNQEYWNQLINNNFLVSSIKENKIVVNKEAVLDIIEPLMEGSGRVIWYDFEGFSMPYPILDQSDPYQQIVFQLSIKETINGELVKENFENQNIVYDPTKIDHNTFIEIIQKIYADKANYYVVYNKGYELTRLKEMLNYIKVKLIKEDRYQDFLKYQEQLNHIKNHTIDLYDVFKGYKEGQKTLAPIFLPELKGYGSIKKIEKYITKHQIKLEHSIVPYSTLEVQNGLMAMNKAIARYNGDIGDREWNEIKKSLKKYCENDVMAMIMVYDFILKTLKEA